MSAGIHGVFKFPHFKGTRSTREIRAYIRDSHNKALLAMLRVLTAAIPNFTGETQATLRSLRDYLQSQALPVPTLRDKPHAGVLAKALSNRPYPDSWLVREKIANLPNAGSTTTAGKQSFFEFDTDDSVDSIGRFNTAVRFSGASSFDSADRREATGFGRRLIIGFKFVSGSDAWGKESGDRTPVPHQFMEEAIRVYAATFQSLLSRLPVGQIVSRDFETQRYEF